LTAPLTASFFVAVLRQIIYFTGKIITVPLVVTKIHKDYLLNALSRPSLASKEAHRPKIEELLPYIDRYERACEQVGEFK
jgi:hypothetical protein